VVVKPTRGIHGCGVALDAGFPAASPPVAMPDGGHSYVVDDGTWLVQRHVGGDASDLKVYVVGDQCFAGAKTFGPLSYAADRIEPIVLDPALKQLVLAVGRALDLRCFGVDLRFEGCDPMVIDVNPFPGYRGFPAAVPALRSEIERVLETCRE
jgi:ribosomal protein S6--L-glutamate ligase